MVDRAIVSVIANIRSLNSAISGFAAEHPIITEVAVMMAAVATTVVAAGAGIRTFGGAVKWAFALASAKVAYFTTAAAGIVGRTPRFEAKLRQDKQFSGDSVRGHPHGAWGSPLFL